MPRGSPSPIVFSANPPIHPPWRSRWHRHLPSCRRRCSCLRTPVRLPLTWPPYGLRDKHHFTVRAYVDEEGGALQGVKAGGEDSGGYVRPDKTRYYRGEIHEGLW